MSVNNPELLDRWLAVTGGNESPTNFHRWAFITATAAVLERNVWFSFGNKKVYPNMYVLLCGNSGARKNGAISPVSRCLRAAGFKKFSKQRTSKQQFLADLAKGYDFEEALNAGPDSVDSVLVAEEEFLDFIGIGNIEFITLLTNLWDNKSKYEEVYKKSSVLVTNPTISILGGITPTNLQLGMPAEAGGIGFLSRALLVYCEPPKVRITFPRVLQEQELAPFVEFFAGLNSLKGEAYFTREGARLVDAIYQGFVYLDDARLASYCSRRLEHLIKLCITLAAMRGTLAMCERIVLEANTILTFTEETMGRAFGEFGKSRNSEAVQKIISYMEHKNAPCGVQELYKACMQDVDRYSAMFEIMVGLEKAERIIRSDEHTYILNKRGVAERRSFTDYRSFLLEADWHEQYEESQRKLESILARSQ